MAWRHQVDNWLNSVQRFCYPPTCLLCGAAGEGDADLCPRCRAALPWNPAACLRCAAPLPAPGICGHCQQHPPAFDRARVPLRYAFPVDRLLPAYKFQRKLKLARLFGQLMAEHLAQSLDAPPGLILPVPLHRGRLRERGYNQALELARPVARRLELPLAPNLCRRSRATASQSDLDAKARRRNVRGAFELTSPLPAQRIAIVDDVISTGSTVGELARLLKRAGAKEVEVWALARAVLHK